MSFLIYDLVFLGLFILGLIIFFYARRKNFKWEGIMLLYRTQVGVKLIDKIAKRYHKQLSWTRYVVISFGILLMVFGSYLIFQLAYLFIRYPEYARAIKVPPLTPLIPYLPSIFKIDFLPPFYFTYWIITIACIALFHEAAHGIFARFANIKVKSTGFGFLGPFLAAFVEPDEKDMKKKDSLNQMAILGAGSFANLVLTLLFYIILILFFFLTFAQAGVMFNTYTYAQIPVSSINFTNSSLNTELLNNSNFSLVNVQGLNFYVSTSELKSAIENNASLLGFYDAPAFTNNLQGVIVEFNGTKIKNYEDLGSAISNYMPGDRVNVKTLQDAGIKEYSLTLAKSPTNNTKPYLGIGLQISQRKGIMGKFYSWLGSFKEPGVYYATKFEGDFVIFVYNLIWWLVLINVSVALFNMLPVGIFDGGRFFYLIVLKITKSEKVAENSFRYMTYFFLAIFLALMVFWGIAFFV